MSWHLLEARVEVVDRRRSLQKGEEMGYFQFGGSDFVMVFERASNVQLIGQPNVHVSQGSWVGSASPYSFK